MNIADMKSTLYQRTFGKSIGKESNNGVNNEEYNTPYLPNLNQIGKQLAHAMDNIEEFESPGRKSGVQTVKDKSQGGLKRQATVSSY